MFASNLDYNWKQNTNKFIKRIEKKKLLLIKRAVDPLKIIKYYNKIKIMVPFVLNLEKNSLLVLVPVPTRSPCPIQVSNRIRMKESFTLILKGLKSKNKWLFQLL